MPEIFTTREVADLFSTQTWRVRRLFEDGTLPEPARFAGKRAIPRSLLSPIVEALRRRGWIPPVEAVPAKPADQEATTA